MKLELATRVVAAELYPDRARLSREGTVDVPVGRCSVRASGLPMAADVDTFRASGSGAATARLLGVRAEVEEFVETPSDQVAALQRDLEAAQDEVALIAARLASSSAMASTWMRWPRRPRPSRGLALRERSVEQQGAVFDFLRKPQTRTADPHRRHAPRPTRGRAQGECVQAPAGSASSGARRQRRVAVIDLDVSVAGALTLAVAYISQWRRMGAALRPARRRCPDRVALPRVGASDHGRGLVGCSPDALHSAAGALVAGAGT